MRSVFEEETALQLQHINIKFLLKDVSDLDPVIPVFHSWIQEQVFDELLLDVADYRHVKDGPGIILIGHEADYSLDNTDGRLGVRYNRKAPLSGSNQDRFTQATRAALSAIQLLEADRRLDRKLLFNGRDLELFVNDRLLAPSTDEIRGAAAPVIQVFADRVFGPGEYSFEYQNDPRRLFGVHFRSKSTLSVDQLLQKLSRE